MAHPEHKVPLVRLVRRVRVHLDMLALSMQDSPLLERLSIAIQNQFMSLDKPEEEEEEERTRPRLVEWQPVEEEEEEAGLKAGLLYQEDFGVAVLGQEAQAVAVEVLVLRAIRLVSLIPVLRLLRQEVLEDREI